MSEPESKPRTRRSLAKHTDLGNAHLLIARYADLLRYVPATGRWHIWNGKRWAPDETLAIDRLAATTVERLYLQAWDLSEDDQKAAAKWAITSQSAPRLAAMVARARAIEGVAVSVNAFNVRPFELNCHNGTLNLKTGVLGTHDPAAMHSQITAVPYRPDAEAPEWQAFVTRVLPNAAVRRYVQKLVGASLVGTPLGPPATLPFLYGEGGTGKSTLLEPILAALGEYGRLAPANLLVAKRGSEQTYDIAALRGKRFVVASEGHSRQRLAEDVVKRITGDTILAGRQIREAEATFPNVTALWFMSNHEPRINSADSGLRRRVKEIPMDVVLGPEFQGLKERIIANELEGVLAWCVEGCRMWQEDRHLDPPREVTTATDEFFDEANPLREWVDASLDPDIEARETAVDLHASYVDWCTSTRRPSEYPSSRSKAWARALHSVGFEPVRTAQWRGYTGYRLRRPPV